MKLQATLAKVYRLYRTSHTARHFYLQTITALALIPLTFCLAFFTKQLQSGTFAQIVATLASPLGATIATIGLGIACYHAALGLQVVVDDYIHNAKLKTITCATYKLALLLIVASGLLAIVQIGGLE